MQREDCYSSPHSSSEVLKETLHSKQNPSHDCSKLQQTNTQRVSIKQNTEITAGSKSFSDVTIFDIKNNHCSKEVISNTKKENSSSRSATPVDSSVPDMLSEDLPYSENRSKLQVDTVCVDSNSDIDANNGARVNNSRHGHAIGADRKNFEHDHKISLPISSCTREIPDQSKQREIEHTETAELNNLTNKHWLHLFEEPFPRRSPRIRNKPNYNEMLFSQKCTNFQNFDFSSKLCLDYSLKNKQCYPSCPSLIDSADNSTCSTTNTAKSVDLLKNEYINSDEGNSFNKPECCLEPEKCIFSQYCKTSHQTSKKKSGRKQGTQKGNAVNKRRKVLDSEMPDQENNWSTLNLINKKNHSNSLCKFLFPKPPPELAKPGGPLSVIVDFSLPDKEFAKLKLQKIKNTRVKEQKLRASLCNTNSLIRSELAGLSEDNTTSNEREASKLKADRSASQAFQTSEGSSTKEEPMLEKGMKSCEIIEVEQKQNMVKERDVVDNAKNCKENQTSYTKVDYTACSSEERFDQNRNHNESETSTQSDLKETVLENQNERNQANKNFEHYQKSSIDLNTQQVEGSSLQDRRKPQNVALGEEDVCRLTVDINTPTDAFDKLPPNNALESVHKCELEMPLASTSVMPTESKCTSLNPQEPFEGPEGNDPEERSFATSLCPEASDSDASSVTVPVLMQSCLQV